MKNRVILTCLLLLSSLSASFSQGKTEYSGFFDSYYYKGKQNLNFTANLGFPFYFGDLCEVCFNPGVGFGVGVNYKLWPRVMFGGEFHYLIMKGSDNLTTRNISFTSTNMEFLGYGRFFLVDDIIRVAADRSRPPKFLKMYVVAGVGLLNYKPTSEYTEVPPITDSVLYSIRESGGGLGVVVPMGIGFSWRISNRLSIVTEAAYRLTFTDYLDEVSLRGNPKKKDGYGVIDVKIQYSPFAKKKKKAKTLAPPEQYDGPKGTDTWKNRKKEPPVQKNNYYDYEDEETPDDNPDEENLDEEIPSEEETPPAEEETLPDGW